MKYFLITLIFFQVLFANTSINFTKQEKSYIKYKRFINICVDPDWLPFEKIQNKNHVGIASEVLKEVSRTTNLKLRLIETKNWSQSLEYSKQGVCDLLTALVNTKERREWLDFTSPYLKEPLVLTTHINEFYIQDFNKLENKKIGIVKDYAFIKIIKEKYPNLKVVEVKSNLDGLLMVKNGELFAYADMLSSIAYLLKKKQLKDLKIMGSLGVTVDLSIGVSKKDRLLLNIIQKSLDSFPDNFIDKKTSEWYQIKYQNQINYTLILSIIFIASLIIAFLTYWIKKIIKINQELKQMQKKLEESNKKLKELSITDRLTSLYNRHKLDETLIEEIDMFQRYGVSFSILLVDIDKFKKINDTYGHQNGDIVLQEVAELLKKHTRKTDIVGRWGGEEFLIICTHSDLEQSLIVANKCKDSIEQDKFKDICHTTVSIGVSTSKKGFSIDDMIKEADDNLYEAKNSGRNKIVYPQYYN